METDHRTYRPSDLSATEVCGQCGAGAGGETSARPDDPEGAGKEPVVHRGGAERAEWNSTKL